MTLSPAITQGSENEHEANSEEEHTAEDSHKITRERRGMGERYLRYPSINFDIVGAVKPLERVIILICERNMDAKYLHRLNTI